MNILLLESFYGGSHQDFADNLIKYSRNTFELFTLPAQLWKWRLRGAALHFYHQVPDPRKYQAVFLSSMINVSTLKNLWGQNCPPLVLYFHENQLSYPLPSDVKREFEWGMMDLNNCLSADVILFNSNFHLNKFFELLKRFYDEFPEYSPRWTLPIIRSKVKVCYPGCDFPDSLGERLGYSQESQENNSLTKPLIVWNHRWEFDKRPQDFLSALQKVKTLKPELEFQLALLGESTQVQPNILLEIKDKFKQHIVQDGYLKNKRDYIRWLQKGDIIISTAVQENFGISVVEGIAFGCFPLLPNRLSYPELIPSEFHQKCLYKTSTEMVEKLIFLIEHPQERKNISRQLSLYMNKFAWSKRIGEFDQVFEGLGII